MKTITLPELNFLELLYFFGPKVFFALLCGGLVGLERELKNKAAGIKTNILICLGAAIYTSTSILIWNSFHLNGYTGDPARVIAQIVSGIGFLGGGAIIQSRGTVLGLTTAANIWVVAAIGICVGVGYGDIALGISVLVVLILVGVTYLEENMLERTHLFMCEIMVNDANEQIRKNINLFLEDNDLILEDFDSTRKGEDIFFKLNYRGQRKDHKKFIFDLWGLPGIREVKLK